jgi:hypothetical protein
MNLKKTREWQDANITYLMLSIAVIEEILSTYITEPENPPRDLNKVEQARLKQIAATAAMPEPSTLQALARSFNLSNFERDLLLLCAGMELQPYFDSLCASVQGNEQLSYPTLNLAMSALTTSHWDAISPHRPLRRWQLIEVVDGKTLTYTDNTL